MTNDNLPSFQQQKRWAMQWKAASSELQRVRDEELRALDAQPTSGEDSDDPYRNGLVEFQRWMLRKAILDAYAR